MNHLQPLYTPFSAPPRAYPAPLTKDLDSNQLQCYLDRILLNCWTERDPSIYSTHICTACHRQEFLLTVKTSCTTQAALKKCFSVLRPSINQVTASKFTLIPLTVDYFIKIKLTTDQSQCTIREYFKFRNDLGAEIQGSRQRCEVRTTFLTAIPWRKDVFDALLSPSQQAFAKGLITCVLLE